MTRTSRRSTRPGTRPAFGCCGSPPAPGPNTVGPPSGRCTRPIGTRLFDTSREIDPLSGADQGVRRVLEPLLIDAGLPVELADALDDTSLDDEIRAETEEALALTGRDVGTPILHFHPPDGTAFFGPVISRLPSPEDAGRLWDHVIGLAEFARVRRTQAQPARTASAGQLRCRHRIGW